MSSQLFTGGLVCLVLLSSTVAALGKTGPSKNVTSEPTLLEKAFVLDEGKERRRDPAAAAALYEKAAEAGDALAHYRLGYLHETGDGVRVNTTLAREHYEAAVAGGIEEARLRLALCHLHGWGGPVDRPAFLREVTLAAERDHEPAQIMMACLYFAGFVVEKDPQKAVSWLERAARQDNPEAQYQIGRHLEQRRMNGLMSGPALARKWYELSAEQEYSAAMRAAGESFLYARTEDRNWELARKWLELATEAGDREAPFILARWSHSTSRRSDEDARAKAWLELARVRGNDKAAEVLKLMDRGRTLQEAMQYLHSTQYEERYVAHAAAGVTAVDGRTPPKIRHSVRGVYPEGLRLLKESGEVILEFVVDTNGRAIDPKVLSSTHPLFSQAALKALEKWRFEPGTLHGQPVNSRMRVPMLFKSEGLSTPLDAMLTHARRLADEQGGAVGADAIDLALARAVVPPPTPQEIPIPSRVLMILVLDEAGIPQRGHILRCEPKEIGPTVLAAAMSGVYQPRTATKEGAPASVVLSFARLLDRGAGVWLLQR